MESEKQDMNVKKLEMGLITDVKYGYVDNQGVGLSMEIRILTGYTSLFMAVDAATKFFEEVKLGSILFLKGRPVVVSHDENGVIKFENFLT